MNDCTFIPKMDLVVGDLESVACAYLAMQNGIQTAVGRKTLT